MMRIIKSLLFGTVLIGTSALADTVTIPAGQQGADNQNMPRPNSGMSMNQVSEQFGEPSQQVPAIGDPPISRWIYSGFTVYFERDRVIHSVLHSSQ